MPEHNFGLRFLKNARSHPDKTCLRFWREGRWQGLTYVQVADAARRIAAGLMAEGVRPGDRVAILSENRPEWALVDLGCILAGAVVVPIYSSMTSRECAYHLDHSGAAFIFVEDQGQLQKIDAVRGELPDLRGAVVMSPDSDGAGALSLDELMDEHRVRDYLDRVEETASLAGADTILTII
ncbi:MAG: AMP-binding protein, partial [Proteobacteria bacterium]|nr:AMP-binding protein [Pseudomonadota bacterium]MBU1740390.1 AMP-binding protein [Pseudomonadota bacterium]